MPTSIRPPTGKPVNAATFSLSVGVRLTWRNQKVTRRRRHIANGGRPCKKKELDSTSLGRTRGPPPCTAKEPWFELCFSNKKLPRDLWEMCSWANQTTPCATPLSLSNFNGNSLYALLVLTFPSLIDQIDPNLSEFPLDILNHMATVLR